MKYFTSCGGGSGGRCALRQWSISALIGIGLMLASELYAADVILNNGVWFQLSKSCRYLPISFTNYNKTETLTNFPALVTLSNNVGGSGFDYSGFLSTNGYDLRFYGDAGFTAPGYSTAPLNYEIESWNTAGASFVWVQIPAFTNGTRVWAVWGDSGNTTQPAYSTNGSAWGSEFKAVYHMDEANFLAQDSTANRHNAYVATNSANLTQSNCFINGGYTYRFTTNGTVPYVGVSTSTDFDLKTNYTISVWSFASNYANRASDYNSVCGTFTDVNIGWVFARRSTSGNIMVFDLTSWKDSGVVWPTNRWALVTYTKANTNGYIYVDGVYSSTFAVNSNRASVNDLYIGAGGPGRILTNHSWRGSIDELRFSDVTTSSNWLWATYMNQASNTTFATFGSTVTQPSVYAIYATSTNVTASPYWSDPYAAYWYDFENYNTNTTQQYGWSLATNLPLGVYGSSGGWAGNISGTNSLGRVEHQGGPFAAGANFYTSFPFYVASGWETNLTICAWIAGTSLTGERGIITIAQAATGAGAPNQASELILEGTQVWGVQQRTSGNFYARYCSSATIDDGAWHHLAVAFFGVGTNQMNIYVDGVLRNDGVSSGGSMTGYGSTNKMIMVSARTTAASPLTKPVDSVKIYERVLTSNEIYTLYQKESKATNNMEAWPAFTNP